MRQNINLYSVPNSAHSDVQQVCEAHVGVLQ